MVFTSPTILWALSLAAVPIIIHLFNFRRYKQLYFSDISLIKEVKTRSHSKTRLRHLAILLSRILFVVLLVLAFANPVIPTEERFRNPDMVSVYVDNSFSMQAATGSGNKLQHAVQAAFEIAERLPKGSRIQLITNEFGAAEKRLTDTEDFLSKLDNIEAYPQHRTMNELIAFQARSTEGQAGGKKTYLISDFNNVLDSLPDFTDTANDITVVRLSGHQQQNVAVDSAWLASPITLRGMEQTLMIRLTNHGDQAVEDLRIKVVIGEKVVANPVVNLEAEQSLDTSIAFIPESGAQLTGLISIEDYPVVFDNEYYFSIPVTNKMKVAEIKGNMAAEGEHFQRLYSSENFTYASMPENRLLQAVIEQADLLIINEPESMTSGLVTLCMSHLNAGNNVLLVLPEQLSSSLNDLLKESFGIQTATWDTTSLTVNKVNTMHTLYKHVFESNLKNINLPFTKGHHALAAGSLDENILTLFNGMPLLGSKQIGKGQMFVITTPLQDRYTNFQNHALFVPAMFNMAARSNIARPLAYDLHTSRISGTSVSEQAEMRSLNDSTRFIPGLAYDGIVLGDQVGKPGWFALEDADSTLAVFAFNYGRDEGIINPASEEEITGFFADAGIRVNYIDASEDRIESGLSAAGTATLLWPYFVALALLMIVLETILLKFTT